MNGLLRSLRGGLKVVRVKVDSLDVRLFILGVEDQVMRIAVEHGGM